MTDTRKKLTFKIPAASVDDFEAAKRQAERELGIAMTANEFAKRVVVQAVRTVANSEPDKTVRPPAPEMGDGTSEPERPFMKSAWGKLP